MKAQRNRLTCFSLVLILIAGCTKITIEASKTPSVSSSKDSMSTATATESKASFKSLPVQSGTTKFRFVAFGDFQGGAAAGGTDAIMKNLRCSAGCPESDFYMNTGDIGTLSLFGNKFPYGKLYPARGNNDYDTFWASIFPLTGQQKNYYSFTHLNTHFVMLYSGTRDASDQFPAKNASPNCANPINQTDWVYCDLESVRNEASVENIIIGLHIPPLTYAVPSGHQKNDIELERLVKPIFEKNPKIRAVLSGHNHFYQRLLKDGINYMVIGGAGAGLYDPDPNPPIEVKKQAKQYHFAIFDVDGSKLTVSVMGYDENKKIFELIEKVDLSCKSGETKNQACSIGGHQGIQVDTCSNGTWVQGECIISPIRCIDGTELCVPRCANYPSFYYKTCIKGTWRRGLCMPGYCR